MRFEFDIRFCHANIPKYVDTKFDLFEGALVPTCIGLILGPKSRVATILEIIVLLWITSP